MWIYRSPGFDFGSHCCDETRASRAHRNTRVKAVAVTWRKTLCEHVFLVFVLFAQLAQKALTSVLSSLLQLPPWLRLPSCCSCWNSWQTTCGSAGPMRNSSRFCKLALTAVHASPGPFRQHHPSTDWAAQDNEGQSSPERAPARRTSWKHVLQRVNRKQKEAVLVVHSRQLPGRGSVQHAWAK